MKLTLSAEGKQGIRKSQVETDLSPRHHCQHRHIISFRLTLTYSYDVLRVGCLRPTVCVQCIYVPFAGRVSQQVSYQCSAWSVEQLLTSENSLLFVAFNCYRSLTMKLEGAAEGLVGSDIEYPEFDPWGFTKGISEEKLFWYRAAELKHARVAMLAALGQIFASFYQLGDPVFSQVLPSLCRPMLDQIAELDTIPCRETNRSKLSTKSSQNVRSLHSRYS